MKVWKEKLKMRLPAFILLVITLLFWGLYDRYERAGAVLVESPTLADATRMRGDCSETNGCFTLTVGSDEKIAEVRFHLPEAVQYEIIRIRGRLRTDGVVVGKNPWRCARIVLIQYTEQKKWIHGYHCMIAEEGTIPWSFREHIFEVDPTAAYADFVLQQTGKAGIAQFDRLLVEPVRFRASYPVWRTLFALAWVGMGILYFRRCRLHQRKLRVLILLNALAIIVGTLMPELWIEETTDYAKEEVTKVMAPPKKAAPAVQKPKAPVQEVKAPATVHDASDKVERFNELIGHVHGAGHFTLFATLCFLVFLSVALEGHKRGFYAKVGLDILLFAAVTESLQHLTNDRTPGVFDWLKDVYGMATAFALFLLLWWIFRALGSRSKKRSF